MPPSNAALPTGRPHREALTRPVERGMLAAVFYLAGAAVVAVGALDPVTRSGTLGWLAFAAALVGVAAVLMRHRFTYSATAATSALGPPLIAAGTVVAGGGWASVSTAMLFTFVAVHTALVLRLRAAIALQAWNLVAAAVAAALLVPAAMLGPLLAVFALVCGTLGGVTAWIVQRVQRQAATDGLTGLANRATFAEALEHARATVARTGEQLSLVALDLDGFKHVNDRHGHAFGDALLVDTARAWAAQLRERDLLARLGGDEFAAVLPGADGPEAERVARRLTDAMPHGAGCSAGVATWDGHSTMEQLRADADRALYRVKARQR